MNIVIKRFCITVKYKKGNYVYPTIWKNQNLGRNPWQVDQLKFSKPEEPELCAGTYIRSIELTLVAEAMNPWLNIVCHLEESEPDKISPAIDVQSGISQKQWLLGLKKSEIYNSLL